MRNPQDARTAQGSYGVRLYSAVFYVDAVQDNRVDGTQTSSINPTATGYLSMPATATELETNQPAFTLTLASNTFASSGGTTATLTRNTSNGNPADTAVTVAITSSDPAAATAPATVTIPAGQDSVTFPITGVATNLLVATRSVTFTTGTPTDPVTGRSFAASAASASVTDTNTPTLELAPDARYVEDNAANPATYATLSLTDGRGNPMPLAGAITVSLSSNDPADLTVPATVNVPVGAASVRIPITVIDNPNNNNPVVTIGAYALDAITSQPIGAGHATTTLSVLSTSGPSLSIAAPTILGVAAGSAQATVSLGSTPLASALTVALASSNPAEATVPATVTIPAGATSAPFTIAVPGGATTGPVTISATAAGDNMAARTITIATGSLPDLSVTSITLPPAPQTGQVNVPVSWQVANDGNGTASGSWNDHVVLSTDAAGKDVIASQDVAYAGGPLAPGASYTASATFSVLPSRSGTYYVTVATDYGPQAIAEITASNDALVSAMSLGSAYYATLQVQAGEKQVPAGSPLTIGGQALYADGQGSPTSAIVYIAVYKDGNSVEEDGPIAANPDGTYSYTFAPSRLYPYDHYPMFGVKPPEPGAPARENPLFSGLSCDAGLLSPPEL